ncbi:hypothetical protein FJY63_10835 [Candidatus Sumerlaeota bacterium]|nr:hypothetical protein [Candidatus Sumerlaeota bacterium]
MDSIMEIEVFRAGDYGPKGRYAPADLRQIAEDYDPAQHEAPVTLDHRQEGPAYGWVAGLRAAGDVLIARLKDLHESLREWIRSGAYKKRSVELYRSFGRTGRPYLRAISFLGACPPEVKGLADPVFREDEGERVIVEFDDRTEPTEKMSESATVESRTEVFAEVEALRGEAARLSSELEAERTQKRSEQIRQFCDEMRRTGRVLPAWQDNGLAEFMLALDGREAHIATSDGRTVTPLEWFEEFLRSLTPQIELGELASASSDEFCRPAVPRPTERAAIRPESLVLHERALAYRQQHKGVSYVEALQAVARV